ncbi:MAG: HAMP domain-containing protein, partial [Clostridia bacterium]|nr:HAMP domain-containing protein [Clostridia bacterium]
AMTDGTRYVIAEPLIGNVTLLTLRDMSDLYALRDQMRQVCLLAALLGTTVVALMSWLLATGFVRPLARFSKAATALGKGEQPLDELPTCRKDEIGTLAQSFSQMQAAIAQREQSLRQEAESRQALLDALAHEMRTPLCALLGNARLMQNETLSISRRNAIAEQMAQEIKRLSDMDAQLMKLTQLRHDPIEQKPLSVRAILQHSADRLKAQANGIDIVSANAKANHTMIS